MAVVYSKEQELAIKKEWTDRYKYQVHLNETAKKSLENAEKELNQLREKLLSIGLTEEECELLR